MSRAFGEAEDRSFQRWRPSALGSRTRASKPGLSRVERESRPGSARPEGKPFTARYSVVVNHDGDGPPAGGPGRLFVVEHSGPDSRGGHLVLGVGRRNRVGSVPGSEVRSSSGVTFQTSCAVRR